MTKNAKTKTRDDFMRRLFAVAISVGFAATLVGMEWIKKSVPPSWVEFEAIVALLVALLATILSWEGYLLAIHEKPLHDWRRFAIDVALVFIYMFLLVVSNWTALFSWTLALIFGLYVVWDALTIREHYAAYDKTIRTVPKSASSRDIWSIYVWGAKDRPKISRGPITTAVWAFYFLVLACVAQFSLSWTTKMSVYFFALAGLICYRLDKTKKNKGGTNGLNMKARLALVTILLMMFGLYVCWRRVCQQQI